MRRSSGLVMVAVLAGCSRASDVEAALAWSDCGDGLQCADFVNDGGTLAVAWHPGEERDAPVGFLGSGGPGGSSTSLVRSLVTVWGPEDPEMWLDRSWMGLDNRGTGGSDPITCVDGAWFDDLRSRSPVPADDAEAAGLAASRDAFQDGCLAERGEDGLAKLGTPTHAADLAALADVLALDTFDFMGFSYGTWLAAVFATEHPERVGRFVLDGVVGPEQVRDAFLLEQAAGFELALDRFFERCAADAECPIHEDPAGTYDRVLAAARVAPLPAPSDPDGRALTANDLRWAVTTMLYGPDDATIAWGLAEADPEGGGDAALLLAAADAGWGRDPDTGEYDPLLQRYWAIGCLDAPWPDGWTDEDVYAFGAELDLLYPRIGSALLTGELTCVGWPVRADPVAIDARDAPPMLLANGAYDPATPLGGAVAMRGALGNGSALLTFEGEGHVAIFTDATGCTYSVEREFVLTGDLGGDTTCP